MIKIQSLQIEQFRGIRNLKIPISGENMAIKGPNGSGKSGIVDAIEFALTGNVTRLTGVGSSGVSVKNHAPHVDCKNEPQKAKVSLVLSLPSGTTFTLERSVASPSKPALKPATPETKAALAFISEHPEFSLSRREILKFILATAGDRAKEVQSLLKLEAIDKTRSTFQTLVNSAGRELKTAESALISARTNLQNHLKTTELSKEVVLKAINERRSLLGLQTFSEMTADIKVSDGIASESKDPKNLIPRLDAITKVDGFITFLEAKEPQVAQPVATGIEAIAVLKNNPSTLSNLGRQLLFETGIDLISGEFCPLCDRDWDQTELLQHLKEKIAKNKEAAETKDKIVSAANDRIRTLRSHGNDIDQFSKYAVTLGLQEESELFSSARNTLQEAEKSLSRPIENLSETETALASPHSLLSNEILVAAQTLRAELSKLPDLSAAEAAKQYLIIADERLASHRTAKAVHEAQEKQASTTTALLNHYKEASETRLAALYDEVEADFARFYRDLNQDDEGGFSARLQPQEGALNFEVDFYGRGKFPPNAYHSEGHQDGMGLCLYFALSKKLLGASFSLCLLDDVLMSVDSAHRREVCKLLHKEFPDTQFILTTHDEVWSKQLAAEGLVKGKNLLQFRKWTVDDGPAAWDFGEVWKEIESDINANNIPSAAQGLRRYLEFLTSELTFKLRANIEARPTANYDLGELLPAVVGRFKDLLKKAKAAANSWNQKDAIAKVAALDDDIGKKYAATNTEQWAVNASVHFNEWVNLSSSDFRGVLTSFQNLIDCLRCAKCAGWYYASPPKGAPEQIRCECGELTLNLRAKQ